MSILKFAAFGCWNEGCKEGSVQRMVADELSLKQKEYKFLILLGDNYYPKINEYGYDVNLQEMKEGFDCLSDIKIPKKMILGNHDIDDSKHQSCSIMKTQLKLPWYDLKFPYDYEDYFLSDKNKSIKFIYIDTTIYSLIDQKNTCYERVINKTPTQLINEQNFFIKEQLKNINPNITNTVIFVGHEPLLTFKFINDEPSKILPLLNELFNFTRDLDERIQLNYICADFHNFEEAYITKKYNNGKEFRIHQLVFGTGGKTNLDDRFNPNINNRTNPNNFNGFTYNMQLRYGSDQPKLSNSYNPLHSNGYGEITIDEEGLKYNFIAVQPNKENSWKNKYLKYKNKYLYMKSQLGGNHTFRIYTTGMCDWGNLDTNYKFWKEFLCGHICSMIPFRFTNIEITHYDALESSFEDKIIYLTESKMNELIHDDINIDCRISCNIFQKKKLQHEDFLKISETNSYLIIDNAHIFKYIGLPNSTTKTGSSIVTINNKADHFSKFIEIPINLNIIYLGYFGDIYPRLLANTKFLIINDDDVIQTYITKMLIKGRFKNHETIFNSPNEVLYKMVEIIRKNVSPKFKKTFGDYEVYDKYLGIGNVDNPFIENKYFKIILNYIIDYIMNQEYNEDEIISVITEKLYNIIITKENMELYEKKYYLI